MQSWGTQTCWALCPEAQPHTAPFCRWLLMVLGELNGWRLASGHMGLCVNRTLVVRKPAWLALQAPRRRMPLMKLSQFVKFLSALPYYSSFSMTCLCVGCSGCQLLSIFTILTSFIIGYLPSMSWTGYLPPSHVLFLTIPTQSPL